MQIIREDSKIQEEEQIVQIETEFISRSLTFMDQNTQEAAHRPQPE